LRNHADSPAFPLVERHWHSLRLSANITGLRMGETLACRRGKRGLYVECPQQPTT
jgi:hypothetical protein